MNLIKSDVEIHLAALAVQSVHYASADDDDDAVICLKEVTTLLSLKDLFYYY